MLILFAILFGGIFSGRLLRRYPLRALGRILTIDIWLLLLLLGLEVGGNERIIAGAASLGIQALLLCCGAVAGSIAAARLLWRFIGGTTPYAARNNEPAQSTWTVLRGSLTIVGFFACGAVIGAAGFGVAGKDLSEASTGLLYLLMFCVGISLGHDTTLVTRIRALDRRMILLPLCTIAGTLAGSAAIAPILPTVGLTDALAIGSGLGYYSLSSIFINELRTAELGAVALLCNVLRELFTLLAAPYVARRFGPLAAISSGGATTFDTTLPVLTRSAGAQYAVVAIFHGCATDFSVPFLVTLFCTI